MNFNDVYSYLGEFGLYQKRIYFLLCISNMFSAMQMMVAVFILDIPDHRCAVPGFTNDTFKMITTEHESLVNASIPWTTKKGVLVRDSCHVYLDHNTTSEHNRTLQECNTWVYDISVFEKTVISQLNLVCRDSGSRSLANSILMCGLLVGSLILGVVSDIIGRKPTLLAAVILHITSGIGTTFAPNFPVFVTLRFLNGASNMGLVISSFVIFMELVGPSKRTFAGTLYQFFWCFGLYVLAFFAYFFRDWQHLQLAISIPSVIMLPIAWYIPESPRWLLSRGRTEDARAIFEKAADVNKVKLPDEIFTKSAEEEAKPQGKVLDMVTSPVLLVRTLIIFFNWLVVSMVYYGLGLNVGSLAGDIFLNFTIASLVENLSYIMCLILLGRLGRKILHCGNMLLGGIACVVTIFPVIYGTSDLGWITTALSMIGKFGASAAFTTVYIFSAELFPTILRNTGMGGSSFSARIGGIVSPYIANLGIIVGGSFGVALPLLVFGGVAILAGGLALFLPETLNMRLPETTTDAKNFGKETNDVSKDKPQHTEESLHHNHAFKGDDL